VSKNIGARDEGEPLPTVPDEKPEFDFDRYDGFDLEAAVFQALGAASMAWAETPASEFDSSRAKVIGDALLAEARDMLSVDLKQRLDAIGIRNTAVELAAQASSNSYQGDLLALAKRIENYIAKGED
jgi:hypothetical protein